ncbi:hypothetical protein BgiMline_019182 [Biomphalaria glabrata]|uniref:Uncharacterized protein LOC106050311 n=1 Tax=Biomphalaria glabrata TaxID=6526 RepID=A0A9U8DUQ9_BIOGL|nr:uncharacterized protein LOC106050311 [Biomphalaria glabrata]KAI8763825.1 hypothetical protein BgiMline_006761 [Biomphalaria glabrata]
MANFPRHLPIQWELYRNEPLKAQLRREAMRHQIEEIDKGRGETDGLWWPDQRYVDVVVPAEYVDPYTIDTFNYRYQVFARPPPVQCEPKSLAEVTEKAPPLSYNIKRIAQCKPLETGLPRCQLHAEPYSLTQTTPGANDPQCQGKNNNSCVERPVVSAGADDATAPAPQQSSCANDPMLALPTQTLKGLDLTERCNTNELLGNQYSADDESIVKRCSSKVCPFPCIQTDTNLNWNQKCETKRCELTNDSPRSYSSYSSSLSSSSQHSNLKTHSKNNVTIRNTAINNRSRLSPLPQLARNASREAVENEAEVPETKITGDDTSSQYGAAAPHTSVCLEVMGPDANMQVNAASSKELSHLENPDFKMDQSLNKYSSQLLSPNEVSFDTIGAESIHPHQTLSCGDANNNERNPSVMSDNSSRIQAEVTKRVEGRRDIVPLSNQRKLQRARGTERLQSLNDVQSMRAYGVIERPVWNYEASKGSSLKPGRRFGYNIPALKDNVSCLLDSSPRSMLQMNQAAESKPSKFSIFPISKTEESSSHQNCFLGDTGREATVLKKVNKGGKRTGYQSSSIRDSITFGGGPMKELCPLYHGGSRRSCQVGGYKSMANSENMKSLIFAQNVNGNNSNYQPFNEVESSSDNSLSQSQDGVIVDMLSFDGESEPSNAPPAKHFPTLHHDDAGVTDFDFDIASSKDEVCLCTNNNSALSDPILNIQLNRRCAQPQKLLVCPGNMQEEDTKEAPKEGRQTPEIPYETYKIVGGQQYKPRPPDDLLSELKLPPHLAEYQEFIKRCPNYSLGRYDRSNPANEMLLPGTKTTHTLRMTRNPFMYARNPGVENKPPLFYTSTGNSDLQWPVASPKDPGDQGLLGNS